MSPERRDSTSIIETLLRNVAQSIKRARDADPAADRAALARQVAPEIRTARTQADANAQAKAAETHNSRTFKEKIHQEAGDTPQAKAQVREEALTEARQRTYSREDLTLAQDKLAAVREAIPAGDVPDWLRAQLDGVEHSPAAAEFAARVAMLPRSMQEDPHVLYRELTRMYYSTPWVDDGFSREAMLETKRMMEAAQREISRLAQNTGATGFEGVVGEGFIEDIDERFNIYRTERIEPQAEDPGDPPQTTDGKVDRKSADFDEWLAKQTRVQQQHELDRTLRRSQDQLDKAQTQAPEVQAKLLENLLRDLRDGTKKDITVMDSKHDFRFAMQQYDVNEAQKYIEKAQEQHNALEKLIKVNREAEQMAKDAAREITRQQQMREQRGYIRYGDLGDPGENPLHHGPDDIFEDIRYMTERDLEIIRKGRGGEEEWFYRFIDDIYGLGKEQSRPSLPEQSKWEEFKNYLKWKYGDDYERTSVGFVKMWDDRGRFDAALKGLMYQPGDTKDKLRAMRILTGSDYDFLYKVKNANYASTLYEQVIREVLSDRRAARDQAVTWLQQEVNNPFGGGRISRENLWAQLNAEANKKFTETVNGQQVTRVGTLTTEQQVMLREIEVARDKVMAGVMLWDEDIQSYHELYIELENLREQHYNLDLRKRAATGNLAAGEEDIFKERRLQAGLSGVEEKDLDKLVEKIHRKDKQFTHMVEPTPMDEMAEKMNWRRGLSPIDMEVGERLEAYLKTQGKTLPEYEMRLAIWAAKEASIVSGRIPAMGAFMAVRPAEMPPHVLGNKELEGFYAKAWGKAVMRSPAFEDLGRIYNPELFAHRFGMGGKLGLVTREILRQNLLKDKKYLTKDKSWHEGWKDVKDPEVRRALMMVEFAEQQLGIPFGELMGPGFIGGGGQYDASGWRLESGVLDQIRNKFLDIKGNLPEGAQLDNQAMGIQLLVTNDINGRLRILHRMMERTPSVFLGFTDLRDRILSRHNITPVEWQSFKRALSMAEMKLWDDQDLRTAKINLGVRSDFDRVVSPFLENVPADRRDAMYGIIRDMQEDLTRERVVGKVGQVRRGEYMYKSELEAIAHHEFPMTVSLTDFDWSEANFFQLGTVAFDRRGRDMESMAAARDMVLDLLQKPALLSPNNIMDTAKALYDLRWMVQNYATPEVAENVAFQMARVVIEFNRNRSIGQGWGMFNPANLGSWVPGFQKYLRTAAETDTRMFSRFQNNKFLNFMTGGAWKHFAGERLEHWPHTMAQALSYSVGFTGGEGNAWDEYKIAGFIATLDDMGIFMHNRNLPFDLRNEFKSTPLFRTLRVIPKYWWIVPVATVAVAASQSVAEEKKESGGGH